MDQTPGDAGSEDGLAPGHRPDRQQHLFLVRAFEQVAAGAGPHGGEYRVIVFDHRDDQDAGIRGFLQDPAGSFYATRLRHTEIHQDHIRQEFRRQSYHLSPIRGFSD